MEAVPRREALSSMSAARATPGVGSSIVLETERLLLRVWTLDPVDVAAGVRLWGDPEVCRFTGDEPLDEAGVRRCLEAGRGHQEEHRCQHWAVVPKGEEVPVGACGFNVWQGGPDLELVVHLAREHWGKGYATEAGQACILHAFRELRAPRVVAACHLENAAARRLMWALGMPCLGPRVMPDSGEEEVFYALRREQADELLALEVV